MYIYMYIIYILYVYYIYIWDLTSESVDFHHHSMEIPSKMLADKLDEFKHGGFKNKFFKGYRGIF